MADPKLRPRNFGSTLTADAAQSVGVVANMVNQARIGGAAAVAGPPIRMGDRLSTGANARLQVTFRDNSVLTLGEQANVVVDRNRAGAVRLSSPGMGTDIPLHKRRWRRAQR